MMMIRKIYDHTADGIGGITAEDVPNDVQTIVAEAQQAEQQFDKQIGEEPKLAIGTEQPKPTPQEQEQPRPSLFGKDFFTGGTGSDATKEEDKKEQPYQPFNNTATPEQEQPTAAQTKDGIKVETFLKVRNKMQAQLCAMIAETENVDRYTLSDLDMQLLMEAYEPYSDVITDKIPGWFMVIAIEAITTGKKLLLAVNDRKLSKAYKREMKRAQSQQRSEAGKNVPFKPSYTSSTDVFKGERTRYDISGKFYTYSRKVGNSKPAYITLDSDVEREPVDIRDTNAIKHIILKNGGWKKVAKSLELDHEWFISRGLNTDNPEIDD